MCAVQKESNNTQTPSPCVYNIPVNSPEEQLDIGIK